MEEKLESDLLSVFAQSVSSNFEDIKQSEAKITALYEDPNRENYIRLLLKFVMYPYDEKNEKKNLYDGVLNRNVKIAVMISIKNFVKKSVHSNMENLELSPDLSIQIKHFCMHFLLDVNNEDIQSLDKYFYEILLYLFKFSICDDYDYLLFYLITLYISDGGADSVVQLLHSDERKKVDDTAKIIDCIMLYVRNKEIMENLTQDNFFAQYPKFVANLEEIKNVICCRNKSLNDDIVNYINNTKRVYKTNDRHSLFLLSDCVLYGLPGAGHASLSNMVSVVNVVSAVSVDNAVNAVAGGISNAQFDFPGKGTIANDYNGNVKLVPLANAMAHSSNHHINTTLLRKKFIAMKIVRKIVKKYKNNDYVSKYDLKIILTHIEFPLTLYFVYLYGKFSESSGYLAEKLNVAGGGPNALLSGTTGQIKPSEAYLQISNCFLAMNYLLQNMHVYLKIFYAIIGVDLPEYFEDNFEVLFNIFNNMLLYDVGLVGNFVRYMEVLHNAGGSSSYSANAISSPQGHAGQFAPPQLSPQELSKINAQFMQNVLKCKVMLVDVIKVISETYQDESKKYIVKLVFSLTQVLYSEGDRNLLCHNYNCLASTIKLIHHMNLNKNDSNPYKDKQFLHKIIERVLHHIRLKRSDIEEILDADLDYFRNDLNKVNSFSVRSAATYFLKTLCDNYFDACFPMLEVRIFARDSLMFFNQSGTSSSQGVDGVGGGGVSTSISNATAQNNHSGNQHHVGIDKNDPFYEACNLEYKIQLITCLGQVNLAQNFYEQNVQHILKEFVMTAKMKYPDVDSLCYGIHDYDFTSRPATNSISANAGTNQQKSVWLSSEDLFSKQNTIYLLSILKFLLNNRSICIGSSNALDVFTFLHHLLFTDKVMIYCYACLCMNRILNQQISGDLVQVIFTNCLSKTMTRLLFLLKYHVHVKVLNEYILITIMRIFLLCPEKLADLYVPVLLILDNTIKTIINDSHNPLFNHYLFELLTLIISLIYKSQNNNSIHQVEEVVISTFSQILQMYVHDFIPYIFQILSIIVDNTFTVQKIHVKILRNLYEMDLWKSTVGNVNGIICVLRSFFKKYHLFEEIIKTNMQQLFNIYHYCLSNKKLSTDSFQIILIVFTYLPVEAYKTFLKPLFVLLFTFLQQYKNDIIKIKVVHALSVLVLKTDVSLFVDTVEQIHAGLIFNVLKNLYMPILDKLINVNEKIIIFLALTKIMSNEKIRGEPFVVDMLSLLNQNITNNELVMKKTKVHHQEVQKDELDKNFEVTYVKLQMINNDNINDTVLRDININLELKQNLYNSVARAEGSVSGPRIPYQTKRNCTMKNFFLNCINNIVKRKRENKVKQLLNFLLAKQRAGHLHDHDVVYPLSALCSLLYELSVQVGRPVGERTHRVEKQDGKGGEHPQGGKASLPLTPTQSPTQSPTPATTLNFLRTSQLHVGSFVEALLTQFHAKGDASEEAIRSCTYLLNGLCLLDYDGQENHSRELLSRVVTSFVQLNRRYLSHVGGSHRVGQAPEGVPTQMGVITPQNDSSNGKVHSQMLVEMLTVMNNHSAKLRRSNEHMDLLSVFYLEVVNYLFASTVLCVTPPVKCHRRVVLTSHINPNRMNFTRIKQFYSEVHLDVHHFVSIALFVKRYADVLNRFDLRTGAQKSPEDIYPISNNHLHRTLSTAIVHIYLNLFWRPKWETSSQGGSSNRRQHICSNEDTQLERVPSPNKQKGATSDRSNPTSAFLSMWSSFPDEFTQLYNSQKINIDLVVRNILMDVVSCLKTLSVRVVTSDPLTCDHFNRRIYSHIVSFKLILNGIDGENLPRRDSLVSAFYVYCHFWDFLIKFYISVIYTNSLVCLLGCFCAGGVKRMKGKGRYISIIRIVNEEVLQRWEGAGAKYVDAPSVGQSFSGEHPHGSLIRPDNTQCPPLLANQRHLFNLCNLYAQLNFHDEAFTKLLTRMTIHNLTQLGRKDIMAVVYFLGKAPPTEGEILLHLVKQIQLHLTTYDMCDLHLTLKTLLKYTHEKEGKSFYTTHMATLLHHVLLRVLIVCSQMEAKEDATQSPWQGKTKEQMFPQQVHFTKTLHAFYGVLLSSGRFDNTFVVQRGNNTSHGPEEGTTALSISQEEMQAVYAKLLKRPDRFTPSRGMLTLGERNPFLRDTLNILNLAVKLMMGKRCPPFDDHHFAMLETRCLPLCDALYLLIKRMKNPANCFSVPEWVSIILCHCKVGHIPDYLNEYLALLHGMIDGMIDGKIHAKIHAKIQANRPTQPHGVHTKDLRLIRMLSHQLKSLRLKNGELFAPFCMHETEQSPPCGLILPMRLFSLLLTALVTTLQSPLFARRPHHRTALGVPPVSHVLGVVGGWAFISGRVGRISNRNSADYGAGSAPTSQKGRRNHFELRGSLNDYIYKLLLRRFKKVTHKSPINIFKSVLSPRRSYNIDFLFSCNYTISQIKKKIAEYMYELKLVDGAEFKAVYLGKRRLVRPIKKQMEAYYVLFSFQMYPSLIYEIKRKLYLQDAVLRFMVTKNEKTSRSLEYQENEPVRQGLAATEAQFFKKAD
ncbi:Uncharacterized protein PCOAH_00015780 [Plasmodium coatneyi]|uniref:Uncharacterized protein n=1 Tax=Plasmodium coatneyi TaxID=208452 RepID=A0A1B1DX93_9APIC|nr:Uncharacterized protein PCOAH_00015780 [Plasmodium coatneyi]ANQ07227.1 Uncharacterized protein PCOAH_00015780 [Plasmodium coatneyi]